MELLAVAHLAYTDDIISAYEVQKCIHNFKKIKEKNYWFKKLQTFH